MFLKTTLSLVCYVSLTALYAQSIAVQNGWDLFGASDNITDMSVFDAACVKSVYAYEGGGWKTFSAGGTANTLASVVKGRGFWVNGLKACTVTTSSTSTPPPTSTTPAINGMYLPDRVVERTETPVGVIAVNFETCQWSAAKGSFKDPNSLSTTYIAPSVNMDENDSITLTITSGTQVVRKTIFTIIGNIPNTAPTIQNISIPTTAPQGSTITLDALVFDDTGAANLQYFWSSSVGSVDSQTSKTTKYKVPSDANGSAIFRLSVCDVENACSEANRTVQFTCAGSGCIITPPVVAHVNTAPSIKSISVPLTAQQGSTITLDAFVLDDTDSLTSLKYFWSASVGTIESQNSKAAKYKVASDADGNATFKFSVCDTQNACSEISQTVNFTCIGSGCSATTTVPAPGVTVPPSIKAISNPSSMDRNQSTAITVFALDSAQDANSTLTYFWTSTFGSIDNNNTASTQYHAPSNIGNAQIKVIVCNKKAACAEQTAFIDIK